MHLKTNAYMTKTYLKVVRYYFCKHVFNVRRKMIFNGKVKQLL